MRALRIIPRVFAAVGVLMLFIMSWVNTRERRFVAGAARASGTVVDLEYSRSSDGGGAYYPVIRFGTAAGETVTFRSRVGSSPPSHHVGETLEVLYDPAAPQGAHTAGFFALYLGSFITGLFALIFGGVGGIWIAVQRRAAAIAEAVRRTGRRIEAKVVEIERRTNIRVGSRHPYRIVAQWQDPATQAVQVFRSANIWFDPTEYVGETVGVFVDPYEPRRHVVDLDFLPKAGD